LAPSFAFLSIILTPASAKHLHQNKCLKLINLVFKCVDYAGINPHNIIALGKEKAVAIWGYYWALTDF